MNMQHQIVESENDRASGTGVGQLLREARERQGMSVNDVANRIKFAPKQIEWLEADDYHKLPEAAFVRGFVRSYARMLEMDVAELLAQLPASHAQPVKSHEIKLNSVDIPLPTALSARRYNIVLLAGALVLAISLALFNRMDKSEPENADTAGKVVVQPLELPSGKGGIETGPANVPAEVGAAQQEQVVPVQEAPVVAQEQDKPLATTPAPLTPPAPKVAAPTPVIAAAEPVKAETPKTVTVPLAPVTADVKKETVKEEAVKKESVSRHNTQEQAAQLPSLQPLLMFQSSKPAQLADNPEHERQQTIRRALKVTGQQAGLSATEGSKPVTAAGSADHHALRLEFDEDTWAEIKDGEGNIISSRRHPAGTLMRVGARGQLDVVIGNAKAVRLFDNGKPVALAPYTGNNNIAHIKLK